MATLDSESRAERFLDAMDTVRGLLAHQCPGADTNAIGMAQLLSLLCDEAHQVVFTHKPHEKAPGRFAQND